MKKLPKLCRICDLPGVKVFNGNIVAELHDIKKSESVLMERSPDCDCATPLSNQLSGESKASCCSEASAQAQRKGSEMKPAPEDM